MGMLCMVLATVPAAAKPQRIVSMNLCADQLLLQLVEPERIASVSFLSADPNLSVLHEQARRFPLNHGLAEEILPLEPDLVLASTVTSRPSTELLRRLGYRVVALPLADDLSEVRAQVMRVAEAVGEPERGRALLAEFDARLGAIAAPPRDERPAAAVYWANGYTYGTGELVDTLLTAAGFDNLAGRLGLARIRRLPLEVLVTERPDFLVIGRAPVEHPALANEILEHPALAAAFPDRVRLAMPTPLWNCGTPLVAEAVERLAALRRGWTPDAARGR